MICIVCKHEIPDDSIYCPDCGNKVEEEPVAFPDSKDKEDEPTDVEPVEGDENKFDEEHESLANDGDGEDIYPFSGNSENYVKLNTPDCKQFYCHADCGGILYIGNEGTVKCERCKIAESVLKWEVNPMDSGSLKLTSTVDVSRGIRILGPMAMTQGIDWLSHVLEIISNLNIKK